MLDLLWRVGLALFYLLIGWLAAYFLTGIAAATVLRAAEAHYGRNLSERRAQTILRLASHLTRALIFLVASIFVLSLFVSSSGLLTAIGLFSAAFAMAARPLVSDYLSGLIFLFEDQYNVGEKVEIFGIEGTVIDVNLRTTALRAPSGEIYLIPNGEVRVVRNFGRGEFSLSSVRITIKSSQLEPAMAALEQLTPKLQTQIPDLFEPPRVLSETGALGDRVDLTVFAKARYGQGAEVRRKLLGIVYDTLHAAGVAVDG